MSWSGDLTAWLRNPGTGPYGPYMDAPGPGNPVIPGQEGLNPNYQPSAAGPSPFDVLGAAAQVTGEEGNAGYNALGGDAAKRTLLLIAGIGIILFSVIGSDDD